jgi:hypothetical protein
MSMGKTAIIIGVIIAVCISGVVFAVLHSFSKSETTSPEYHVLTNSEGRHLTLNLTEDINVKGNP